MIRRILFVMSLFAFLSVLPSALPAGMSGTKKGMDPVTRLRQEQQAAREKELRAIGHLKEKIRHLETELAGLDAGLNRFKRAGAVTRDALDEMVGLVKAKEKCEKELAGLKKDLSDKETRLEIEDARRREEMETLKADLKKDERRRRIAALKQDVRKYQSIISSPSVRDMGIKASAWKALAAKYPKESKDLAVGDLRELQFRVNFGGITNSMGMRFVLIQAGKFRMGSPAKEKYRSPDETRHRVTIKRSFYLQTTEVTQGQWIEIMGKNPSVFKKCGKNCPVENVSWDDCQTFIRKLNEREHTDKYRLPTEAEWEYACRAGKNSAFSNGGISVSGCSRDRNLDRVGWYCANSWRQTHPVARKEPNAWGLYDMHGNVWEWCSDWYGPYPKGPVVDPKGARYGPKRVIRGGSCLNYAEKCRCAYRLSYKTNIRMKNIGFRVARTQ